MNLPNLLTTSRFFLAILMGFLLAHDGAGARAAAFSVFLLASMTDYWDGKLARARGQITRFGQIMDPLADKMLTLTALFGFALMRWIPMVTVVIVAARDVLVTLLRFTVPPSPGVSARGSGKQKTFLQLVFIVAVLLVRTLQAFAFWPKAWDAPAVVWSTRLMWVVVVLTVWSGLRYIMINVFGGRTARHA